MRSSFFLLLCVLFFCFALQAGQALELAEIVGMELEKAYKDFGTPVEVFPVRGEEEWQDDVVLKIGFGRSGWIIDIPGSF